MADFNVLPADVMQQARDNRYLAELRSYQKQGLTTGDEAHDRQLLGLSYEFEKMMLSQMMSAMRKTADTEGLFGGENFGGDMFQDMMDSEFINQAKGNLSLGLAGNLYRTFVEMSGNITNTAETTVETQNSNQEVNSPNS